MGKLSGLSSKLPFGGGGSSSGKLSKAFRIDKQKGIMGAAVERTGDPYLDGPSSDEPLLKQSHMWIHLVSLFCNFLGICLIAAVASFQAKWYKVSGGVGFVLFLTLLAFFLTLFMLVVPIVYDRWDRLKRPAQFLAQIRSRLILQALNTAVILLSAFIVTISAFTAKGCKNADNDPHAGLGDSYKQGLPGWCSTKKASGIFDWLAFAAAAAVLVLLVLEFRRERRREPSFLPPSTDYGVAGERGYTNLDSTDSYAPTDAPQPYTQTMAAPVSYTHAQLPVQQVYPDPRYAATGPSYDQPRYSGSEGRGSGDAYGAFEVVEVVPTGGRPGMAPRSDTSQSRTMQMAYNAAPAGVYNDPYAAIRTSLVSGQGYAPVSNGYGGYR